MKLEEKLEEEPKRNELRKQPKPKDYIDLPKPIDEFIQEYDMFLYFNEIRDQSYLVD